MRGWHIGHEEDAPGSDIDDSTNKISAAAAVTEILIYGRLAWRAFQL